MGLVDFVYRAVVKIGIRGEKLFFSRGAVNSNGRSLRNTVAILRLPWDVGLSITIPRNLRYGDFVELAVDGAPGRFRVMELAVLMALLSVKISKRRRSWYADMAATIIARGWSQLEKGSPLEVTFLKNHDGSPGRAKGNIARPKRAPRRKPAAWER